MASQLKDTTASSFADVPVEAVRDYWNARPCNVRHSPKDVGTRDYFDEVEARKYRVEPHIPKFADFAAWKGKRVLEVGCGIGTDTINFARAGATVTAVDLSDESLQLARRRADVFGLQDRITFHQANAEELTASVLVETYDLVYSFGVIHHTPHPEAAIRQVARYMGPGSTAKIMVYNRWSWKVLWILATYGKMRFWDLDRQVANHSEAETGCPVTYTYSRSTARQLLAAGGLDMTRADIEHIFAYHIPDYVQYRYVPVWPRRLLPDPAFHWLEHHLGWHLCLTARLQGAPA